MYLLLKFSNTPVSETLVNLQPRSYYIKITYVRDVEGSAIQDLPAKLLIQIGP